MNGEQTPERFRFAHQESDQAHFDRIIAARPTPSPTPVPDALRERVVMALAEHFLHTPNPSPWCQQIADVALAVVRADTNTTHARSDRCSYCNAPGGAGRSCPNCTPGDAQ